MGLVYRQQEKFHSSRRQGKSFRNIFFGNDNKIFFGDIEFYYFSNNFGFCSKIWAGLAYLHFYFWNGFGQYFVSGMVFQGMENMKWITILNIVSKPSLLFAFLFLFTMSQIIFMSL